MRTGSTSSSGGEPTLISTPGGLCPTSGPWPRSTTEPTSGQSSPGWEGRGHRGHWTWTSPSIARRESWQVTSWSQTWSDISGGCPAWALHTRRAEIVETWESSWSTTAYDSPPPPPDCCQSPGCRPPGNNCYQSGLTVLIWSAHRDVLTMTQPSAVVGTHVSRHSGPCKYFHGNKSEEEQTWSKSRSGLCLNPVIISIN